jgi:hypothetical protein
MPRAEVALEIANATFRAKVHDAAEQAALPQQEETTLDSEGFVSPSVEEMPEPEPRPRRLRKRSVCRNGTC